MDCYDIFWDGANPTPDHPIKGVATNPHYDPQRKSLGDIRIYAERTDIVNMIPVTDTLICSTSFCLANISREYIIYQPDKDKDISLDLPAGEYECETFNTIDSSVGKTTFRWKGGIRIFRRHAYCKEDWVLYIKKTDLD